MEIKLSPRKLEGVVDAMPSKSHAHRILIAQKLSQLQGYALAQAPELPSFSEDIEATKSCLKQLDKANPYLECRESASTLRFLLPVAMALKDDATFIGTGRLPDRPLSPLKEEMERHGCRFRMGNNKNSDRFKEICSVKGRLEAGDYFIAGNVSSQFISGLLFALPLLDGDSRIILTTELESSGYVDMSLDVLNAFGIEVEVGTSEEGFPIYVIWGNQVYVEPEGLTPDGDWSNAAFWLAAGVLSGDVTVRGLNLKSSQRDKEIMNILAQMGAELHIEPADYGLDATDCESDSASTADAADIVSISAKASILKGIELDVSQIPDLSPVLAILMTFAEGTSMIKHCERLKYKESNRIKSIFTMLSSLGADISYGGDNLSFTGKAFLEGGDTDSHGDHRIAMSATIASCLCMNPIYLSDPLAVSKSYPDFFNDFQTLGGELEHVSDFQMPDEDLEHTDER